jgi:hypothetical protein
VVAVQWPGQVGADAVRALWVQAQRLFSPFAGWPPPREEKPVLMRFAGREVDLGHVALALGVVSSRSALWEVQTQIGSSLSIRRLPLARRGIVRRCSPA